MPTQLADKSPADVVEYTLEFVGMGEDSIGNVSLNPTGISILENPAPKTSNQSVTFWVSGGLVDHDATVEVTIKTNASRTFRRVVSIPIRDL